MDVILYKKITDADKEIQAIESELGLNGEDIDLATACPLILDVDEGKIVHLDFTTASSYLESGKNLYPGGTETFTQSKNVDFQIHLPAGTYVFSCVATSNDTDSSKCSVSLRGANGSIGDSKTFNRGERINVAFTVNEPIYGIYLYASNSYVHGAGDTATFTDIQFERSGTVTGYEAYSGSVKTVSGNDYVVMGGNRVVIISNDGSNIRGYLLSAEPVLTDISNAIFETVWNEVALTLTTGVYYKLTGAESSFANAKASAVVPVVPGEKVKVSTHSQESVAGILFFNSSSPSTSSFVGYSCYNGSTTTYTDEIVTVPDGATYAIVQGNKNYSVKLKKSSAVSKFERYDGELSQKGKDEEYTQYVMGNRLMAIERKVGFAWGSYPNMILTLRVDDLRADVDKIAKIVIDEYGLPLVVAACAKEINKAVTGISDPAEKIGDTRIEVCQWVQNHGGEVVVHPDNTVTSGDYETSIKPLFLNSKRLFEDNGVKIRGTAVANSEPNATLKKQLDPYLYGFYDYADDYGSVAPYTGITTEMIRNFSNASDFATWLDTRIAYQTPIWRTLVMHEIGDDVTEQVLKDILDVITDRVENNSLLVMTWGQVFDTYRT